MALTPGALLNERYRIQNRLGRGGFGAIYMATDELLNRPCAVKENLDSSVEAERQFVREARFLAQLDDPGLPDVYDYFTVPHQGQYLVMTFIPGTDLMTLVERQGPLSPETAVRWIRQVGAALTYLHNQEPPVIHRDVKPANIILTPDADRPDRAMLVDFGLAKTYATRRRTTHGARAISPGFSPPEQYALGGTDARSDVYALGATLYYLLTGREPPESVQRTIRDTLRPPQEVNSRVPPELSAAVLPALAVDPQNRYTTIAEFLAALPDTGRETEQPALEIYPPAVGVLTGNAVQLREDVAEYAVPAEAQRITGKARPDTWFRRNLPVIVYALVTLSIVGLTLIFTLYYVNRVSPTGVPTPGQAAGVVAGREASPTPTPAATVRPVESPTNTTAIAPTISLPAGTNTTTPQNTPSPTATSSSTPPPLPSLTPSPPLPPGLAAATSEATLLFAAANTLSTPQGNRLYFDDAVETLPHDRNTGMVANEINIQQEDFVVRAVFANPYSESEWNWDYGFLLRYTAEGTHLEVSISSDKSWELRFHEDEADIFGSLLLSGEIANLNTNSGETNSMMVILEGGQGYLVVNETQIYLLDLSDHVAPGTIRVATGIRPGYKRAGDNAVTLYWDLSINDLAIE